MTEKEYAKIIGWLYLSQDIRGSGGEWKKAFVALLKGMVYPGKISVPKSKGKSIDPPNLSDFDGGTPLVIPKERSGGSSDISSDSGSKEDKEQPGVESKRPWARKHDKCIECGTSKRVHMGRGLCTKCYMAIRQNVPKKIVTPKKVVGEETKKEIEGDTFCQNPDCTGDQRKYLKTTMVGFEKMMFHGKDCLRKFKKAYV